MKEGSRSRIKGNYQGEETRKKRNGKKQAKQEVLLKCTQDFVLMKDGKMTDLETTILKERTFLIVPKRAGPAMPHRPQGQVPGPPGGRRCQENS